MINNYICYTSTTQVSVTAAEANISAACGFPNNRGTLRWDVPKQAVNQNFWFIKKPPPEGYNLGEFTQAQMIAAVDTTNLVEQVCDDSWFPIEVL